MNIRMYNTVSLSDFLSDSTCSVQLDLAAARFCQKQTCSAPSKSFATLSHRIWESGCHGFPDPRLDLSSYSKVTIRFEKKCIKMN